MNRGVTRVSARLTYRIFKEPGTRCGAKFNGPALWVWVVVGGHPCGPLANCIPHDLAYVLLVKARLTEVHFCHSLTPRLLSGPRPHLGTGCGLSYPRHRHCIRLLGTSSSCY